ncbi:hypothetical protein ACFFRR_005943 [Megaselia abdita]
MKVLKCVLCGNAAKPLYNIPTNKEMRKKWCNVVKKTKCQECLNSLRSDKKELNKADESLLKNKSYNAKKNSLVNPSAKFFRITKIFLRVFDVVFRNYKESRNIRRKIMDLAIFRTNKIFPTWFQKDNP